MLYLWLPEKASVHQIAGKYVIDSAGVMCSTGINYVAEA